MSQIEFLALLGVVVVVVTYSWSAYVAATAIYTNRLEKILVIGSVVTFSIFTAYHIISTVWGTTSVGQEISSREHFALPLDPFVVNLADESGSRFFRVTMKLVINREEIVKINRLEEDEIAKSRVRSAILESLMEQHADKLITPQGKAVLKQRIAEAVGTATGVKIDDVLFSEFIVQF